MGRAGNPGGPQRVSAHVVPKAKPYPGGGDVGDEDEKTTIESQWEDEASTTVEHGSGNGTVVNGNVEDNPFMLANGDTIEIGNTVFRFEQEKAPTRQPQPQPGEEYEEELSTVAGKPMPRGSDEVDPVPTPVAP